MPLGRFGSKTTDKFRISGGTGLDSSSGLLDQSLDRLLPSTKGTPALSEQFYLTAANYGFNLLRNGNFEVWLSGATSAPTGWVLTGAGASIAKNTTDFQRGLASVDITSAINTATDLGFSVLVSATQNPQLRGRKITFSCQVKASTADRVFLRVNDGVDDTDSLYHTGSGLFEELIVSKTLSGSAGQLAASINISSGASITATADTAILVEGGSVSAFAEHPSDVFQTPAAVSATSNTTTTSATYVDLNAMSIANIVLDGSLSVLVTFNANVFNDNAGGDVRIQLVRGSTQLTEGVVDVHAADSLRPIAMSWIDSKPAAGTYTYKAQFKTSLGTAKVDGRYMSLVVIPSL